MSKNDKNDDQPVATPNRSSGTAEKAGNAVREAADKNGHAAREAADHGREAIREGAEKTREAVAEVGAKGREMARDVAEKSGDMAREAAERTAAVVESTADRSMATFTAAADYAGIWRELATAQLAHNMSALQQLAAARGWQEQMAVQQGYLLGNLERIAEASTRCLEQSGALFDRPRQRQASATKRAA